MTEKEKEAILQDMQTIAFVEASCQELLGHVRKKGHRVLLRVTAETQETLDSIERYMQVIYPQVDLEMTLAQDISLP